MTDFRSRHIAIILHDFSAGGSERIPIRLTNRWVQMGRCVALREILSSPDLGTIAPARDPRILARAIAAQLDRLPPSRESVQRATEHHGLDASAISYLALFDRIAR